MDTDEAQLDLENYTDYEQLYPDLEGLLQEQVLEDKNSLPSVPGASQPETATLASDLSISGSIPASNLFELYLRDSEHGVLAQPQEEGKVLYNLLEETEERSGVLPALDQGTDAMLEAEATIQSNQLLVANDNLQQPDSIEAAMDGIKEIEKQEDQLNNELKEVYRLDGVPAEQFSVEHQEEDSEAESAEDEEEDGDINQLDLADEDNYNDASESASSSRRRSESAIIEISSSSEHEATPSPEPIVRTLRNLPEGPDHQNTHAPTPSQARLLKERTRQRLDRESRIASGYESEGEEDENEGEPEGEESETEELVFEEEDEESDMQDYRKTQKRLQKRRKSVENDQDEEDAYFQDEVEEERSSGREEEVEEALLREEEYDSTSSHGTAASQRNKRKWDEEMEDELDEEDVAKRDRSQNGSLEERVPIPAFFKKQKEGGDYDMALDQEAEDGDPGAEGEDEDSEDNGMKNASNGRLSSSDGDTADPVLSLEQAPPTDDGDFHAMTTEEALAVLDGSQILLEAPEDYKEQIEVVEISEELPQQETRTPTPNLSADDFVGQSTIVNAAQHQLPDASSVLEQDDVSHNAEANSNATPVNQRPMDSSLSIQEETDIGEAPSITKAIEIEAFTSPHVKRDTLTSLECSGEASTRSTVSLSSSFTPVGLDSLDTVPLSPEDPVNDEIKISSTQQDPLSVKMGSSEDFPTLSTQGLEDLIPANTAAGLETTEFLSVAPLPSDLQATSSDLLEDVDNTFDHPEVSGKEKSAWELITAYELDSVQSIPHVMPMFELDSVQYETRGLPMESERAEEQITGVPTPIEESSLPSTNIPPVSENDIENVGKRRSRSVSEVFEQVRASVPSPAEQRGDEHSPTQIEQTDVVGGLEIIGVRTNPCILD